MNLALSFADLCVAKLLPWLQSVTHRCDVAGSVRRRRSVVGDLDFVAVPKLSVGEDLMGHVTEVMDVTAYDIRERAKKDKWTMVKDGPSYFSWQAASVQVDLWLVDPGTYVSNLICRTGSKEHNVAMATRARDLGLEWKSTTGLFRLGKPIDLESEEDFYKRLKLPFIPPESRDFPALNEYLKPV
jgi:DNA polymerase (family 10)